LLAYLILGITLLAGLLLAGRWFASADPKTLVKVLKRLAISLIVVVAVFFLVTGRLGWALMALPALMPWFMRFRSLSRAAKNFSRMAQATSGGGTGTGTGQTSEVETRFLRMSLDHDSGVMNGEVIDGPYAGRSLDEMVLAELVGLLNHCLAKDRQSAQVLEAYLDRVHAGWREEATATDGASQDAFGNGTMSPEEAYRILGLEAGATGAEIKEAHHRLIAGLHPDHGGSTYLAAKINQAKDVLLGH
jgi:hypothetical protein